LRVVKVEGLGLLSACPEHCAPRGNAMSLAIGVQGFEFRVKGLGPRHEAMFRAIGVGVRDHKSTLLHTNSNKQLLLEVAGVRSRITDHARLGTVLGV